MEQDQRLDLLEKAIKTSKSSPKYIKTKGFFAWRVYEGKPLYTRYDVLETFPNPDYVPQARKDIFYSTKQLRSIRFMLFTLLL